MVSAICPGCKILYVGANSEWEIGAERRADRGRRDAAARQCHPQDLKA